MSLRPEQGTIEAGKLADFLILDTDPLLDIQNLREIHRVVKEGRVFDPQQLLSRVGAARGTGHVRAR